MNVVEDEAVVVKGDGALSEDAAVPVLTNDEVEVPEEDQVGMMREETRGEDDDLEVVAMTGVYRTKLYIFISSKLFFLEVQ